MIKTLWITLLWLFFLLPTGVAQNTFPSLETYQVTKDEIYWSYIVRYELLGRPYKVKELHDLVQAYMLKDKSNPNQIEHLDRIRYGKYASEITGGRPELMITGRPDIQHMLFNQTIGTSRDFLIGLKRVSEKNRANAPIYGKINQFFEDLGTPFNLTADELVQTSPYIAILDQQQEKIRRAAKHGKLPNYFPSVQSRGPANQFAGIIATTALSLLMEKKKHYKKAYKFAKKALDIADDYYDDDDQAGNIEVTFEAPLHNSTVNIVKGDYHAVHPEFFEEHAKKLSAQNTAISKKLEKIQAQLTRHQDQHQKDRALIRDLP